jgi:hypothetical protein
MTEETTSKLFVRHEPHRLQIVRSEKSSPILIQHAAPDNRPYIHPIIAPDGKGCLTENQPWHHFWQHGLYTGLHGVNGVDFWCEGIGGGGLEHDGTFHPRPLAAARVAGNTASWQVETDWRSPAGEDILTECQTWRFEDVGMTYRLDLQWELKAKCDIRFDQCPYGGLFLRLPWHPRIGATALDSEGRGQAESEGKRSRWAAVSLPLPGREDNAGIAILEHPGNPVYPSPWRVDGNYGISPSRCILGEWRLGKGETSLEYYRLFVFCGGIDSSAIEKEWSIFSQNKRGIV